MSRPRRRGNARQNGNAGNARQNGNASNARQNGNARKRGNARGGRGAGNNRSGGGRNTRGARKGRAPASSFWRDTGDQPRTAAKIQPTTDPSALPRSLGEPPLAPDTAPLHHLAVVYEEAVRTATALAAANGLLLDDGSPGGDAASDGAPADPTQ